MCEGSIWKEAEMRMDGAEGGMLLISGWLHQANHLSAWWNVNFFDNHLNVILI